MKLSSISPTHVFLVLVALGIVAMSATFVMTGFTLQERERELGQRLAKVPLDQMVSLTGIVPGDWAHICVLSSTFDDPGKTRNPDPIEGMLLKPMRSHAVFLKGGYWVLVSHTQGRDVLSEYRVDGNDTAVAKLDGKANYCVSRDQATARISSCRNGEGCNRRIGFFPQAGGGD